MQALLAAVLDALKAFPMVVKIIQTLRAGIKAGRIKAEVKESLEAINEAFDKEDPKKLNDIFKR